jgi:hypothetical protein
MPVACLLGAVAAALVASASAQSGGGCTTTLISLYPCLNYISGNVSAPAASCCSSLSSVVQSNPQCLCTALSGDSSALGGITIDKNRARQLPKACNVQTPPESRCNCKQPLLYFFFMRTRLSVYSPLLCNVALREIDCVNEKEIPYCIWLTFAWCFQLLAAAPPAPRRQPRRPPRPARRPAVQVRKNSKETALIDMARPH